MSSKKYTHSVVNSIREEQLLFELCSNLGLSYNDAFRRGVLWSVESHISTGFLPEHLITDYNALKENDIKYLNQKHIENIQNQNKIMERCPQTCLSSVSLSPRIIEDLFLAFTPDEMKRYCRDAASSQVHTVRLVIPSIRKIYENRTGKPLPIWSPEEEITILNHLIDLGGVHD